jgi:hypothetical protein
MLATAAILGSGAFSTGAAAFMGIRGWGADSELSSQVRSVRNGTPGAGRVFIGGGLRGGK